MEGFRERTLIQLMAALNSSLNLKEVLSASYEVLSRLLAADYAAICVSKPDTQAEYDWVVEKIPKAFFARYAELADGDFVRLAVMRNPNKVLRDSEMLSRAALKRSAFYRYCRELQMPLEYVMAVLLDVRLDWHGGFTLYRESPRRPFSDRERRFLQQLTPVLASTVRNCRMVADMKERGALLETLFHHVGTEKIVLVPRGPELMRTEGFTPLMRRWFAPVELNDRGLPMVLVDRMARLASLERPFAFGEDLWERQGADRDLRVTFVPLPEQGGRAALGAVDGGGAPPQERPRPPGVACALHPQGAPGGGVDDARRRQSLHRRAAAPVHQHGEDAPEEHLRQALGAQPRQAHSLRPGVARPRAGPGQHYPGPLSGRRVARGQAGSPRARPAPRVFVLSFGVGVPNRQTRSGSPA